MTGAACPRCRRWAQSHWIVKGVFRFLCIRCGHVWEPSK